ncbi:hypothetical protein [Sphaerisporangium sp. TRM90804]|uniref:hypothetical protein n=1 Tax=Sphaerisporangium sp. TRM90804 TaxID=3031113 RepID=UPI00244BA19A|nr:hypothetical protein [Sphaerisporangium sp. TRM90804]MDH2424779.1 hypothetical protein [Sphaerisporangium sp. TRM90804]
MSPDTGAVIEFLKTRFEDTREHANALRAAAADLPEGTALLLSEVADRLERDIEAHQKILRRYARAVATEAPSGDPEFAKWIALKALGEVSALEDALIALAKAHREQPGYAEAMGEST